MSKILGIDLGSTASVVSIMEGGKPLVIANESGNRTTPSVVSFSEKDGSLEILVGELAKRQSVMNPKNTVFLIKRLMGRKYDSEEVQKTKQSSAYEIVKGANGDAYVRILGKDYSPQQISSMILCKMKKIAEDYLGEEVTKAVISCPAYFNSAQREAVKDSGKIAGLEVLRVISEPTSAALSFGENNNKEDRKICVMDIGGSTSDVSILEISEGVFETISTSGDMFLGGADIDNELLQYIVEEFKKSDGIDLSKDPLALQRVKEATEKAKCELSSLMETTISLPFITADANGAKHLNITISRSKFESMSEKYVDRMIDCCKKALDDAKFTVDDIDEIVLVGGLTRMPLIQKKVKEFFHKEPTKSVNPDEAIAIGSAIQGSVLSGDKTDVLLLDVTPLSLGIETLGGAMTVLIPRNTTIPSKKTEIFSTAADNQTGVTIKVYQGERSQAALNKLLGEFELTDIPAAPRGVPKIEVSFDIDVNGILKVSAKDLGTNKEREVVIKDGSGLSEDDINRMVKEAEEFKKQDEEFKKKIEIKNNAETLIRTTENSLKEYGDKLSDADKSDIETKLNGLKSALTNNDSDIETKMTELQTASYKIADVIYKNNAQNNPQNQQNPFNGFNGSNFGDIFANMTNNPNFNGNVNNSDSGKGDTIDADFTEH